MGSVREGRGDSSRGGETRGNDRPERTSAEPTVRAARRWSNLLVVSVAVGTALVAVAFAAGRSHLAWAFVPFLAGWVLTIIVLAVALTSRSLTTAQRILAVCLLAAQQSLVRWMYSPRAFTFPDEMQHWRSVVDLNYYEHLFRPNPTLPISPYFPGLEEITTAVGWVGKIGLFPAGLIVASTAHIALAAAMFFLFRRVSENARVAGFAAFLFALVPLQPSFGTMFVYQVPALLIAMVALELALTDRRGQSRKLQRSALALAIVCIAGAVVTHHVTAAVLVGTLGVLYILQRAFADRSSVVKQTGLLFLVGVAIIAAWTAGVAPSVVSYLGKPLEGIAHGLLHLGHRSGSVPLPAAAGPGIAPVTTILATVVTACLLITGVVLVWRRIPAIGERALPRSFAVCSLAYFGVLGVRVFAADGAELAGRLLTFAGVFTTVTIAFALIPTWEWPAHRLRNVRIGAVAASLIIFLGALTSGWPAPWEIIPGTFHAGAFESGIDRQNTAAERWFKANVGPGRRVACELSECYLLGASAAADPIPDEPALYYETRVDRKVEGIIKHRRIEYVFVDRRMSREAPITGHFFRAQLVKSGSRERAVPLAGLTKFDGVPGVQLIYDSGPIQIYDVKELRHG